MRGKKCGSLQKLSVIILADSKQGNKSSGPALARRWTLLILSMELAFSQFLQTTAQLCLYLEFSVDIVSREPRHDMLDF